jgi:hypothetical protein
VARNAQRLWEIERTPQVISWQKSLTPEARKRVDGAIEALCRFGPALPRPFADGIKGSRHHNMKELRVGNSMRILFAFDRRRHALLLVGGDKRGNWKGWYRSHVQLADRLLAQHQRRIGPPTSAPRFGRQR